MYALRTNAITHDALAWAKCQRERDRYVFSSSILLYYYSMETYPERQHILGNPWLTSVSPSSPEGPSNSDPAYIYVIPATNLRWEVANATARVKRIFVDTHPVDERDALLILRSRSAAHAVRHVWHARAASQNRYVVYTGWCRVLYFRFFCKRQIAYRAQTRTP